MTAGRPISQQIRTICTVLEKIGPANARQIHKHTEGFLIGNVNHFCYRALALGMMTVKLGNRKINDCNVYTINPDWHSIAKPLRLPKIEKQLTEPVKTKWHGVNSVFGILKND